jgi:hypothetical protein
MTPLQLFMIDLLVDKNNDAIIVDDKAKTPSSILIIRTTLLPIRKCRWGAVEQESKMQMGVKYRAPSSAKSLPSPRKPSRRNSHPSTRIKGQEHLRSRSLNIDKDKKSKSSSKKPLSKMPKSQRDGPTTIMGLDKPMSSDQHQAQAIVALIQALSLKAVMTIKQGVPKTA